MHSKFKIILRPPLREPEPKMHTKPCKNCPSAHFPPDPEALAMESWPHEERVKTAFPCGWNGKRYCKGYCDKMGVTNNDLENLHLKQN